MWRAYWTPAAIAERLAAELDLYRRICHERWTAAMNDVRGDRRMGTAKPLGDGPTHAEFERRRAVPGDWPPTKH